MAYDAPTILKPTSVMGSAHSLGHLRQCLVDGEARGLLSWWKFFECRRELRRDRLRREDDVVAVDEPVIICVGSDVRSLERVRPQVVQLRKSQGNEWFRPNPKRTLTTLLHEYYFPIVIAERNDVSIIVEIHE